MTDGRLTKLVYLSDWRACLDIGNQISTIEWYFDNFGPYVKDVKRQAEANPELFKIEITNNDFGSLKRLIKIKSGSDYKPKLSDEAQEILNKVTQLNDTKTTWSEFIKFIYKTYPVVSMPRYSYLNLKKLSSDYKKNKISN